MKYKDPSRKLTHPQEQEDQQYQFNWLEHSGTLVCLSRWHEKAQVCVHLPFQLCSSVTAVETNLQEQRCGVLFSFPWIFSYFPWAPLWWGGTGEGILGSLAVLRAALCHDASEELARSSCRCAARTDPADWCWLVTSVSSSLCPAVVSPWGKLFAAETMFWLCSRNA